MIKQISWQSYWYAIAITLLIYYIGIIILYYSNDVKILLARASDSLWKDASNLSPANRFGSLNKEKASNDDEGLFTSAQHLIAELNTIIQVAASKNYEQQLLLSTLHRQISNYPQLLGTAFQVAVNNFIKVEIQINCSINLSEDDLTRIWKKV